METIIIKKMGILELNPGSVFLCMCFVVDSMMTRFSVRLRRHGYPPWDDL